MSDGERSAVILKGMEGKRLTYRPTDKLAAEMAAPVVQIGTPRKRWRR